MRRTIGCLAWTKPARSSLEPLLRLALRIIGRARTVGAPSQHGGHTSPAALVARYLEHRQGRHHRLPPAPAQVPLRYRPALLLPGHHLRPRPRRHPRRLARDRLAALAPPLPPHGPLPLPLPRVLDHGRLQHPRRRGLILSAHLEPPGLGHRQRRRPARVPAHQPPLARRPLASAPPGPLLDGLGPGRRRPRAGRPQRGHGARGAEFQPHGAVPPPVGPRAGDDGRLRLGAPPELRRLLLVGPGRAGRHGQRARLRRVCVGAVALLCREDPARGGCLGVLLWARV